MLTLRHICALLTVLCLGVVNAIAAPPQNTPPLCCGLSAPHADKARETKPFAPPALAFEANRGQHPRAVKFAARGDGFALFVTSKGATLSLRQNALEMSLVGARQASLIAGENLMAGRVNYLRGGDARKWQRNVPLFSQVRSRGVYRGIDLVFHGKNGAMEYDFVVAPRANPKQIRLKFNAAGTLDNKGNLIFALPGGKLVQRAPVVYQEVGGKRVKIQGSYQLHGREIGFKVGDYNRDLPLVIDPVLSYSTYLGGSGNDRASDIAVDGSGNATVIGTTSSPNFPTTVGSYQSSLKPNAAPNAAPLFKTTNGAGSWSVQSSGLPARSVRAAIIDPQTSATAYVGTEGDGIYKTTNGGANWTKSSNGLGNDDVRVLAINPLAPNTIYAGTMGGGAFRSTNAGANWTAINNGLNDGDIQALAVTGSNATTIYAGTANNGVFKSVNGGNSWTEVNEGLATFDVRGLTIAGNGIYAGTAGSGVYVTTNGGASWNPANVGIETTTINAIAASPTTIYAGTDGGQLFVSTNGGTTWTLSFGKQGDPSVGENTAIVVDPQSPATVYASFLSDPNSGSQTGGVYKTTNGGGSWVESNNNLANREVLSLAIDPRNPTTLFAGTTAGGVNPKDPSGGGTRQTGDAFVAKLTANGGALVYATYIGGGGGDSPSSLALNSAGEAVVVGTTTSTDFPTTTGAFSRTQAASFLLRLSADGSQLRYATQFGGNLTGVAVGAGNNAFVTGLTNGAAVAATPGAFDTTIGGQDAFVARFDTTLNGAASLKYATYLGGSGNEGFYQTSDSTVFRSVSPAAIAVDGAGNAYLTGNTGSTDFPTTANAFDRTFNDFPNTFVDRINTNAYFSMLSPDGARLIYSSFLGGGGFGADIAVGPGGAYIAGETRDPNFPVKSASQTAYAGNSSYGGDAFVAKFNPALSGAASLVYATYLGGGNDETATAIAVDGDGAAYVTGQTASGSFPTNPCAIQPSLSGRGIYKSFNAAASWRPFGRGLSASGIIEYAINPQNTAIIYAATDDGFSSSSSVFKSLDGGANWNRAANGLPSGEINSLDIDPANPNTLYVGMGSRGGSGGSGVFKTTNGGASWTNSSAGLPAGFAVESLAIDPSNPMTLYVGSILDSPETNLYKSTNGGASWAKIGTQPIGPSGFETRAIAVAPGNGATVYAALFFREAGRSGIYKSTNGGVSFVKSLAAPEKEFGADSFDDIIIDPKTPATVYVHGTNVFKTINGGANWALASAGLPTGDTQVASNITIRAGVQSLAIDASNPQILYAGLDAAVYKTTNGGARWTLMRNGLPSDGDIEALAVDPRNGAAVYAGTESSSGIVSFRDDGGGDAFVVKLAPSGASLLFATYLGGTSVDEGQGIAVDGNRDIYVAGRTLSPDFPTTPGAFGEIFNDTTDADSLLDENSFFGTSDAFVTKIAGTRDFAQINVSQTASAGAAPAGSELTYTISVTNAGTATASDVTLSDLLPAGARLVSSAPAPATSEGEAITFELGDFAPGEKVDLTLKIRIGASSGGTITNTATASALECNLSQSRTSSLNTMVTGAASADVSIALSDAPDPVVAGQNLTYTLQIANLGPNAATGVVTSDTLPANVTFVSANSTRGSATQIGGVVSANIGDLAVGASATVTIVVRPNAAGILSNTATVRAATPDPVAANNTATQTTTVLAPPAPPTPVVPTISIADVTVNEGNAGATNAVFTVSLSRATTASVAVSFATKNVSATAPGDYAAQTGKLTFAPGETRKNISVVVNGDTVFEPNEGFFVNLTNPIGATLARAQATGIITNDDAAPVIPAFSINDVRRAEGNAGLVTFNFIVTISSNPNATATIRFATANGTATAPTDYAAQSGTLTFVPNGTRAQTISVVANGDRQIEPNETFTVNLSNATNATISDAQGVGVILNDDVPPPPTLSIGDVNIVEGNAGRTKAVLPVTLIRNGSVASVTVKFATRNGSATAPADYVAQTGTLTFAPTETRKNVDVAVVGDTIREANETFLVVLSAPTIAVLAKSSARGTIQNDDFQADLSVTASIAPARITPGAPITITLIARNNGPDTARAVRVADTLPRGATVVSSAPGPNTNAGGVLTYNLGDLASGATRTITLSLRAPSVVGAFSNRVTIAGVGATEVNVANNAATASANVVAVSVINITPQVTVTVVNPRAIGPYTPGLYRRPMRYVGKITIQNKGATAIQGPISIALDNLTKGVEVIGAAGVTRVTAPVGSSYFNVTLPGNQLAGRQSATVNIEFRAPGRTNIRFTPRVLAGQGAR